MTPSIAAMRATSALFAALLPMLAFSGEARAEYQTSCTLSSGYPGNPNSLRTPCALTVADDDHLVVSSETSPTLRFARASATPKIFTLNGIWRSSDFSCEGARGAITESVTIAQSGDSYAATKINGDDCAAGGQAAFSGTIAAAPKLVAVNPFLAPSLGDISEAEVVALSLNAHAAAKHLGADGVSAAIIVAETTSADSVTLTASNGATLLPYDPAFLTKAVARGASRLVVTPAPVGGHLYAFALLQTPPAGVKPDFAAPITVISLQNGVKAVDDISLTPPPLLLVHGLWGTNTSLALYQQLIRVTPPWSAFPSLVQELTYPGNLNFNSSTSVLDSAAATASALKTAWGLGIVASRVDTMAHSMGGLLLRSFSDPARKTAPYRSIVNRKQGALHTIVTLDTPETGSALATYLLRHQTDTLRATLLSDPIAYLAWQQECGSNPATTVAQCFAALGNPVTGGAVASLVPGNPDLIKAPSPDIADADWLAVSATNTSSNERDALDLIIRALYASKSSATNVDAILGTPNDDIVNLASQIFDAASRVTFSGLSHTDEFGDPSVVDSAAVAATAKCWLLDPGNANCEKAPLVASPAAPTRWTPGRLSVAAPTTARLGRPLTLILSAPGVRRLPVEEISRNPRPGYKVADSVTFDAVPGGAPATLTLRPTVMGPVRLVTRAEFEDGSTDETSSMVDVALDPADFVALKADADNPALAVQLGGGGMMTPVAEVKGLANPVDVASFTTWRLAAPLNDPPLTISSAGELRAIHPGVAIVEGVFEGVKTAATVTVAKE